MNKIGKSAKKARKDMFRYIKSKNEFDNLRQGCKFKQLNKCKHPEHFNNKICGIAICCLDYCPL